MTSEERIAHLERILTQRFSRSSKIEEELMAIGIGKRDLPTREECREWAIKLGVPEEYRVLQQTKREQNETRC